MGRWIKILSIVGVLMIALVVAGIAILKSIDFNEYKGLIAEKAKEATGRDLKIVGNLELEISLTPKVSVEGVSFSNAGWSSRPEMVTVKKFAAEMSLIPLLSGQIEINRVILEGVDLLAEKNKAGKANWEFSAAMAAKKPDSSGASTDGDVALPIVHMVSIKDVKVIYKDAQAGAEYALNLESVDLSADGTSSPLNLDVKGIINGQGFSVDGQLGSIAALAGGDMFPVKLDIAALAANIGLQGQAGVPGGAPKADIKLALKGASLADTLTAADALSPGLKDIKLPVSGGYHVNSQIKLNGATKVSLENLDAGLGALAVKGRVAADLGGARPALNVALSTDTINLDELMPKGDAQAKAPPADDGDGRVFPKDPLPLDGLKVADAKVKFTAKTIIMQGMKITDVDLGVSLANGRLKISPLLAGFGGGKINGDIALNASGKSAGLKVAINVKGLDYGTVLTERGITDIAEGILNADINVSGSGASVRQIMAGLNGKSRIVTKDGKLKSGALNIISTDLTSMFDSADDKKIICGVIDHRITKGMANTYALVFETGGISVVGTGSANLADETIKMRVDPRSKKANVASMAMVPVNIKGTFAKPDWEVDMAAAGNVAAGAARTGLAVGTLGLSLLAEAVVKKAGSESGMIDKTDYCTPALAGKKVVPGKMAKAETKPADKPASTEAAPTKTEPSTSNPVEGISKGLKSLFGN
jgi:AsmA family protein